MCVSPADPHAPQERADGRREERAGRCPGERHIATASRVGTTGSGGSPYTSGSSSSRKNAPSPPTPSFGSCAVQPGLGDAEVVQLRHPRGRPLAQLVELPELDRVGRARLRARRLQAVVQPVVAQRALLGPPVARRAARSRRTGRPTRSSRSRCRCPAARPRCRTRCGTARRSGRRPGTRRACSACTRPTPSASGARPRPAPGIAQVYGRRIHRRLRGCSMNATCRHAFAPSAPVLS